MLVLALLLSRMRQITSVTAVSDISNMGTAKYHSFTKNVPKAFMCGFLTETGDATGSHCGRQDQRPTRRATFLLYSRSSRTARALWAIQAGRVWQYGRGRCYSLLPQYRSQAPL